MSLILTIIWFVLFVLTISTAQKNGRSLIIWTLVALVFSPVLSLICLWLIGEK